MNSTTVSPTSDVPTVAPTRLNVSLRMQQVAWDNLQWEVLVFNFVIFGFLLWFLCHQSKFQAHATNYVWAMLTTCHVVLVLIYIISFKRYSSLNDILGVVEFCNFLIFLLQYATVIMGCTCYKYDDVLMYDQVPLDGGFFDKKRKRKIIAEEDAPFV